MAWDETKINPGKPQIRTSIPKGVPHVCLLLPHWGSVSMEWVESTYGPLRFIPVADFAKSNKLARGILNIDTERNMLVKSALEDQTVTHLMFLDTDCIFSDPKDPNQAIKMLLSCDTDIVSGLYRAKKAKGEYPWAMFVRNPHGKGYISIPEWTGNFITADVIGFGCVLLKREVFEKVPHPWFEWKENASSEDFFACEKFKKYGYEIKVFTDVKLSHCGSMKVLPSGKVTTMDV